MSDQSQLKKVSGGLLVAFEGIDGAGKTTQAKSVQDELTELGYDAVYLREPTDGPYGRKLREQMINGRVTPEEEFELFLLDREQDVRENIKPALERGAVVLIDRYYISSIAYQGALGLDPKHIREENEKIAPVPDLLLIFELPVEESLARIRAGRSAGQNLFEKQHYQERVHAILRELEMPNLLRIDASRDEKSIRVELMDEILGRIAKVNKPRVVS